MVLHVFVEFFVLRSNLLHADVAVEGKSGSVPVRDSLTLWNLIELFNNNLTNIMEGPI